ncbi:hypothetical protein RBB50_007909 [Rhinocladiella similis]
MVTAVSVHRGTPTLSVTPTQNTAPVHEFRCLYTRDLHKKAKKWHDGSLRFHTFNQRVMVYDDAKNYIGDLHYRQEGEFGEGVEIQLDRGVKVEVGERLGETETDLAPILERQRPERATPQKRAAGGLGARSGPSIYSQGPKSLLEVLGPSQGRLGHSRLPLQSPYEQRQTAFRPELNEPNEPHLKRRRLSNDKENRSDESVRLVGPNRPCLPQPVRSNKPDRCPVVQETPPTRPRPVVDISSDEESDHDRVTQSRTNIISSFEPSRAIERPQRASKSANVLQGRNIPETNGLNAQITRPTPQDTTKQLVPKSKIRAAPTRPLLSIQRKARLLLGRPRPKSKLKVLQPFEKADTRVDASTSVGRTSPREEIRNPSPLAPSPDAGLDSVRSRISRESFRRPNNMSSARQYTVDSNGPEMIASSPLFLPEDENRPHRSPTPPPLPTQEEFPFLAMSMGELEQHERLENDHRSFIQESASVEEELQEAPELDGADLSLPDGPQAQDFQEPKAPSVIASASTLMPNTRNFRRVFSENDVVIEDDAAQSLGQPNLELRSPLKILNNLSTRQIPVKSKSPQKFQRCASDTATLTDAIEDFSAEDHGQDQERQTGPWTSDEAFLLFDWWPPEVHKPGYWAATVEKPSARAAVAAGVAISGYPTVITTARQFLRDDVNAL